MKPHFTVAALLIAGIVADGEANAGSLQGSWSSCSGVTVVIQGNNYSYYENGQALDAGTISLVRDDVLLRTSDYGAGQMVYGFGFRADGRLFLMETPQRVYDFWRTHPTPAMNRCECVFREDRSSCFRAAQRGS